MNWGCAVSEPRRYVLDTDPAERERLLRQGQQFAPMTTALLDQIGVRAGWRAIDVGCGPLGILDLLSERVGAEGEVVGLEREEKFLDVAQSVIDERGWQNVRLVPGDATASGLAHSSFDLAHERLVLIVSPEPERIVAEMVALVRPGGIVALEDFALGGARSYPASLARERLSWAFEEMYRRRGQDPEIGLRLAALLGAAGLLDITVKAHAVVRYPASEGADALLAAWGSARDEVIARGVITAEEFDGLLAEARAYFDDPGALVVGALLFQAWGRKPSP